jgi:hypothetical protein
MADAKKLALATILFLALMLQAGFCNWGQELEVSVADQGGAPVAGANVKIVYQKANGITGNDGLAEGTTNDYGKYATAIANTVPEGMEDLKIKITASAYDWKGETKTVQAGSTDAGAVSFVAPFTLGKLTLVVLQANGKPARGASVYITGSEVKRAADSSGKAVIYLPEGSDLTGFASYESEGDYFSTADATVASDGSRELVVKFPNVGTGPAAPGSTMLTVKFTTTDNKSLSGEKIVFSYGGTEVSAYTDAGGKASIDVDKDGEVVASVRKNDYNYSFSFNVTADGNPKSETAVLAPLLKIDYFESTSEGAGCYRLSAKASDPRLNKPISIRMMQVKNDSTPAGEIRVALDENNMHTGRVCAGPEMSVKVIASNAYETVERVIPLSQVASPEPPKPANASQPQNSTPPVILPKPVVETSPIEGLGAIFVGIVMLVLIFGAAIIALGRTNPQAAGGMTKYFTHTWGMLAGSTVRPIVEYLRSLIRKKEPPQSSFGQGPMMPQG